MSRVDIAEMSNLYREMEDEGIRTLEIEGLPKENICIIRSIDLRYLYQSHEVEVNVPTGQLSEKDLPNILEQFHQKHESLYGYCERDQETEVLNLRVTAIGKIRRFKLKKQPYGGKDPSKALKDRRSVFFAEYNDFTETPIYDPDKLMFGNVILGPAIIEEATTTVVIYPKFQANVDGYGNYVMKVPT